MYIYFLSCVWIIPEIFPSFLNEKSRNAETILACYLVTLLNHILYWIKTVP